jgi:hypothetical protein
MKFIDIPAKAGIPVFTRTASRFPIELGMTEDVQRNKKEMCRGSLIPIAEGLAHPIYN